MAHPPTLRFWRRRLGRPLPAVLSSRRTIERPLVALLIALTVAATGVGTLYFSGVPMPWSQAPAVASVEPDHRTGSILYVPVKGPMCEVHRFDNATGQVVPNGFINCERKVDDIPDPMGPNGERSARLRAISGAFKK